MIDLIPGQVLSREKLHDRLRGQRYGGISTPAREPVILIFSGEQGAKYGYVDGFQSDGSYWYTGEGQVGDMTLTRGNLAITRHRADGKDLLLFEYARRGVVQYVGRAEYLKHHPGVGPDREGNPRETIVFELYLEGSRVALPNLRPDPSPTIPASLRKRSLASLRKEAYTSLVPEGMVIGGGHRNTYRRSGIIKAYVLKRANGKCEGCESPAPFTTSKDEPYLEPHHIARRADGGPDHPRWVIALCPNCHARVHRGGDGHDYNIYLAERVALIEDTLEAH